jgi:hypothetical protein
MSSASVAPPLVSSNEVPATDNPSQSPLGVHFTAIVSSP